RPEVFPDADPSAPRSARALVRRAREMPAEARREGVDWRAAVDYIRRRTAEVWRALSTVERGRLMRHAVSAWETHRYLMPPASHRRIQELKAAGRLMHVQAEVLGTVPGGVRIRSSDRRERELPADVVINASGFDRSYGRA